MVQERIKQFIVENFYVTDPGRIEEETSLINEGIVDSTGMLEVIAFLESEFGIPIADTDMTPQNLETLGRIVRFVEKKKQQRKGADSAPALS
jgi:acyl carrier protein